MAVQPQAPVRLASEEVIINAPLSYVGSAQRIMRIRRSANSGGTLAAITLLALALVAAAWVFVTAWYLIWGLWLVPYRLLRRGARKRKAEALRHRELMGTIQGSAAASAAMMVTGTAAPQAPAEQASGLPAERVGDSDRERAIVLLRQNMLAGRLTTDEFEERVAIAHGARTRADLVAVSADLPLSTPLVRQDG